jgi:flagellar motor switch protein FliG
MTGIRKAAVVLRSLDKALAAEVMAQMGEQDVQSLTKEMAGLEDVDRDEQDAAVEEFCNVGLAHLHIERGGMESARDLLERSLGKEKAGAVLNRAVLERAIFDRNILDRAPQSLTSVPFGFLQNLGPENLIAFVAEEHPQTIALILSHLPAHLAAQVLAGLPSTRQLDVVRRVATMEPASPDVLHDIEKGLESRIQAMFHQPPERASGVTSVAQMLNVTDRLTNKSILAGLGQESPELVDQIRRLMFVFDDLTKLDDRSIQKLVEEIELSQWALSLKGASEKLKDRILENLAQHDAALLQDEIGDLGPVRISDVETAQQAIVAAVHRLEEAGEIVLVGEAQRLLV